MSTGPAGARPRHGVDEHQRIASRMSLPIVSTSSCGLGVRRRRMSPGRQARARREPVPLRTSADADYGAWIWLSLPCAESPLSSV